MSRALSSPSPVLVRAHMCENIIGTINYLRGHTGSELRSSFVSLVKFGILAYVGRHVVSRDIFVSPAYLSPHMEKIGNVGNEVE